MDWSDLDVPIRALQCSARAGAVRGDRNGPHDDHELPLYTSRPTQRQTLTDLQTIRRGLLARSFLPLDDLATDKVVGEDCPHLERKPRLGARCLCQ